MRFLRGIKIGELPEGRKLLAETQWITGEADRHFYSRPQYTDVTSIYEGLFDTDAPPAKGYKELFDMKGVSVAGATKNVKFLVIAFKDANAGTWKVLGSLDNADHDSDIDIEQQVSFFSTHVSDTRFTPAQENLFLYGRWLLLDGRIKEAKTPLESAKTASTMTNFHGPRQWEDPVRVLQINALIDVANKIAPDLSRPDR